MPEITEALKAQEREILTALGWRVEKSEPEFGCLRAFWFVIKPNGLRDERLLPIETEERALLSLPNLSDPSTLLSLFRPWCRENGFIYTIRECPDDHITVGLEKVGWGGLSLAHNELTQTIIEAWHQLLSTLGKIKAG